MNQWRGTDSALSLDGWPAIGQIAGMIPDAIHLTRQNPACNMARYYQLQLVPDLFGGVSLVRHWGRIGGGGRMHSTWFAKPAEARAHCDDWLRRKLRRGYRVMP
ncbi:WGR domain-containing protein [uncultured Paracoccus sp.]|uniref:WGR domain-containing protein n=1 Tax=uncultured Paracoccus sp. TaxID=189685 RepID=UPI0026163F02|nr:WGR domain-containing protein [uncultured Paracoccus sp.]